jgi:hypothetical protein
VRLTIVSVISSLLHAVQLNALMPGFTTELLRGIVTVPLDGMINELFMGLI